MRDGFPTSVTEHYANLHRLRCVVSDDPRISIHHCHGGSTAVRLAELGLPAYRAASKRGYSDALVIPLAPRYHYAGMHAIDGGVGVPEWESLYGNQADHLDDVGAALGYSLWELHKIWTSSATAKLPSFRF